MAADGAWRTAAWTSSPSAAQRRHHGAADEARGAGDEDFHRRPRASGAQQQCHFGGAEQQGDDIEDGRIEHHRDDGEPDQHDVHAEHALTTPITEYPRVVATW